LKPKYVGLYRKKIKRLSTTIVQLIIFTIWIYTQLVENTITISIADNGIGIKQNIINKIFDPFFTTKPVGKGAGLGLSMSYQTVVRKHNGNLWCDSTHGLGSKFVIEIPIKTTIKI
jgi:signal transduction histidine kinase